MACVLILEGTFESLPDFDKAIGSSTTFGTNFRRSSSLLQSSHKRSAAIWGRNSFLPPPPYFYWDLCFALPVIFPFRGSISTLNNWETYKPSCILKQIVLRILDNAGINLRQNTRQPNLWETCWAVRCFGKPTKQENPAWQSGRGLCVLELVSHEKYHAGLHGRFERNAHFEQVSRPTWYFVFDGW